MHRTDPNYSRPTSLSSFFFKKAKIDTGCRSVNKEKIVTADECQIGRRGRCAGDARRSYLYEVAAIITGCWRMVFLPSQSCIVLPDNGSRKPEHTAHFCRFASYINMSAGSCCGTFCYCRPACRLQRST